MIKGVYNKGHICIKPRSEYEDGHSQYCWNNITAYSVLVVAMEILFTSGNPTK